MDIEHTAERPSWDCTACGKPWPCEAARKQLTAQMDPTALRIYAWLNLEEAAGDLGPGLTVGEAFDRFLHWTRPR